jgi:chemotaxis protein histidine kinase CheA
MVRSHAAKQRFNPRATRDEDLIARAEAAVAQLSLHFSGWMQDECRRLGDLCRRAEAHPGAQTLEQLFGAAHDIKGEASTFGFPLVERVAASLCRLITDAPDRTRIPFSLIAQHVDAVRPAISADLKSAAVTDELERATAQYLADARSAGEYPNVQGPPLAPSE